jgi:hypothetical protein
MVAQIRKRVLKIFILLRFLKESNGTYLFIYYPNIKMVKQRTMIAKINNAIRSLIIALKRKRKKSFLYNNKLIPLPLFFFLMNRLEYLIHHCSFLINNNKGTIEYFILGGQKRQKGG